MPASLHGLQPLASRREREVDDDGPKSSPLPRTPVALADADTVEPPKGITTSRTANLLFDSTLSPPPKCPADADADKHPTTEERQLNDLLATVRFTELDSSGEEGVVPTPFRTPQAQAHAHAHAYAQEDIAAGAAAGVDDDDDSWFGGVHLTRDHSPSPQPHASLSAGASEAQHTCNMCARLAAENRRLRRLLDEADFRLAVASADRHSHASSSSASASSWRSSLSARSRSSRSAEKSRLRAEVNALGVTTEYLWRKLATAERELQYYRAGAGAAGATSVPTPTSPPPAAPLEDHLLTTRVDPTAVLHRALSH